MSKKRNKKHRIDRDFMAFSLPVIPGATGYTVYGIAPIPVRLDADNMPTRIEATSDGYNVYGVKV
jgi:hypothetical protein